MPIQQIWCTRIYASFSFFPSLQFESECDSLRQSCDRLESANGSLEQRCHELSQQLKIATLALKELQEQQEQQEQQGSNEVTPSEALQELNQQVEQLRDEVGEKDRRIADLEEVRKRRWVEAGCVNYTGAVSSEIIYSRRFSLLKACPLVSCISFYLLHM